MFRSKPISLNPSFSLNLNLGLSISLKLDLGLSISLKLDLGLSLNKRLSISKKYCFVKNNPIQKKNKITFFFEFLF